jgi:hypothetical protein
MIRRHHWSAVIAFVATAALALAQSSQAVCSYPFSVTGSNASATQSNIRSGCASWSLVYSGTAPITVETSADGTTWGTTGISVSTGSLPTSSGFGLVKFTGYAPYFRIKGSGGAGTSTSGLLYGSLGLTAATTSAPTYTAIVPSEWTALDSGYVVTRTDRASSFLIDTTPGNVGGSQNMFFCKTVAGSAGTYRLTYRTAGMIYSGTNEIGISLLNSSNRENVVHLARATSNTAINYGFRCASNQTTCGNWLADDHHQLLGAAETKTLVIMSSATHWGVTGYDPVLGRTLMIRLNDATLATKASYPVTGGFDRVCVWIASTDGNYSQHHEILGFDYTP